MSQIETLHTLTLRELQERLTDEGVDISYSSLSELVNTGDVAAQLGIEGERNGRRIPLAAVQILTAWLPLYRAAKGRLPQAPEMLGSFLQRGSADRPNSQTTQDAETLTSVRQIARTLEPAGTQLARLADAAEALTPTPERLAVFDRYAAALEAHTRALERQPAPDDALLDATGVQQLVPKPARWLRENIESVKAGRTRLWKRSVVQTYIAGLE